MSKLKEVREALNNNPNIDIVDIWDDRKDEERPFWLREKRCHFVYFYVAPKTNEFDTCKLQDILMSLFTKPTPTRSHDFSYDASDFYPGRHEFEECIGKISTLTKTILSDKDMFSTKGFVKGKHLDKETLDIKRYIEVILFPSANIAREAIKKRKSVCISKRDIQAIHKKLKSTTNAFYSY